MDPVAHASVALMAKSAAPKAPLAALIAATQVPDLLFFAFEAAGIEHQAKTETNFREGLRYLSPTRIPYSHGLLMCIVWSILAGLLALLFSRDRRTSIAMGLMVFSHWLLDFIVYPIMPIAFDDSNVIGLGLITSGPGFIAGIMLEIALIGGGVASVLIRRKQREMRISRQVAKDAKEKQN